jgi:hypothetical protein
MEPTQIPAEIALGAIQSEPDYRDSLASAETQGEAGAVSLPAIYATDLTQLGPVMMQGQQPSCVSHAWAMLMKLYWFRQTGEVIDFSPRFLDILSAESDIPLDGGRRPRTVAKIAAQFGCCTTAMLPNNVNLSIAEYRDRAHITQAAYAEAAKYRIPGYVRISDTPVAIRQGILAYGALSGLFSIGSEFWLPSWADSDIDPLRTPRAIVSGHELVLKGWVDSTMNILRNQWSAAWANQGEAKYDQTKWSPYISEVWAIAQIPQDVQDFLNTLPKQSDFHYEWDKNLALGDVGVDVKFAQVALMILGHLGAVPADQLGFYGPKTAVAVAAFQSAHKITPTAGNSIGPKTRVALNALFAI